jgi:hypothetical protein
VVFLMAIILSVQHCKMASRLRQGGNTCPEQATGAVSWEAWLQQHERTRQLG